MPTYVRHCDGCNLTWDVVARIADRDEPAPCTMCGKDSRRLPAAPHIGRFSAADWNRVEYNQALGQWTTSAAQARKLAKDRGMVEIGNDTTPEAYEAANVAAREAARAEGWAAAERAAANNPSPDPPKPIE